MENQIPDDELIHQYQNGDEDAFCQLLEGIRKKFLGIS